MFRRLSEPLPLSEASLLALRPAVNRPHLAEDSGPEGPARAAIVVFGEEWGGFGIALGIRSLQSGERIVFRNQESIESRPDVLKALQPLLLQAERLGFRFDEDMLSRTSEPDVRARALALWESLMGEVEVSTGPVASDAVPPVPVSLPPGVPLLGTDPDPGADGELILEEVVPAAEEPAELVLERLAEPVSRPPQSPSRPQDERPHALGRIPLVRVHREERSLPLFTRLLVSF
jgi:hypothetical protein